MQFTTNLKLLFRHHSVILGESNTLIQGQYVGLVFLCSGGLPKDCNLVPQHVQVWYLLWIEFYDWYFIVVHWVHLLVNILNIRCMVWGGGQDFINSDEPLQQWLSWPAEQALIDPLR
jgi:hypothetical protein